jgi:predicted transcriptional regulator
MNKQRILKLAGLLEQTDDVEVDKQDGETLDAFTDDNTEVDIDNTDGTDDVDNDDNDDTFEEEPDADVDPIKLTQTQKVVMLTIKTASSSRVAYHEITNTENDIGATDILVDLELIEINDQSGTVEITDKGLQVLKDEQLIDDSDQLTTMGQKLLPTDDNANTSTQPPSMKPDLFGTTEGVCVNKLPTFKQFLHENIHH